MASFYYFTCLPRREHIILKWRLFLFTRVMSRADMLVYLFGEYRDNEIAISSRNNSNNQKWHISESRCCVSPISFRAAHILIPNLPKSSTGIIVHFNNILSCRLWLWNDLIILVNKHDCSGCGPDLIGESLLNK